MNGIHRLIPKTRSSALCVASTTRLGAFPISAADFQSVAAFKTQPAEIMFPTFGKPPKAGYHLLSDPQISQMNADFLSTICEICG